MFIHTRHDHFLKMVSLQEDSHFYVPSKTIYSIAEYVIMDYFDQAAIKSRRLISLTEGYW